MTTQDARWVQRISCVSDNGPTPARAHDEFRGTGDRALGILKVDGLGFDRMDRRRLRAVIEKFDGGPVGVESPAAAIGEERGTIEEEF